MSAKIFASDVREFDENLKGTLRVKKIIFKIINALFLITVVTSSSKIHQKQKYSISHFSLLTRGT